MMRIFGSGSRYTVVYASFVRLDSAVFVADADGRNARVLVQNFALDLNPPFAA